jgi:hypothetical protein
MGVYTVPFRENHCHGPVQCYGASDRVALGGYPPRAPTDPYVLALEHTVPQIMGSLQAGTPACTLSWRQIASVAIHSCLVDTIAEFRCIRRVSQERSML